MIRSRIDAVPRVALAALARLPRPVLRGLGRGIVTRRDGHELDPQMQLVLAVASAFSVDFTRMPLDRARVAAARLLGLAERPAAPCEIQDLDAGVPVRLFRPPTAPAQAGLLVFFHGGGGVINSIQTHHAACSHIALQSRCLVASVDYRLAPEHRFPAAVDDAFRAYCWLRKHAASLGASPERVAVGGDSLGGNLAILVCLRCTEAVPKPALAWLLYPWVDATLSSPSIETFANGYILTRDMMHWFRSQYFAAGLDFNQPEASPLSAELAGMPPTILVTAGFDPLRDEGRLLAERLQRANVAVDYRCHPGLTHAFIHFDGVVDAARDALDEAARLLAAPLAAQ